ncbi:hypothetical protein EMUCRT_0190 [Ehrlichia cf. muris str. EmCRT]|uniref:Uncharacterized protein n=1 Tax=Ehrlichia cf. muris str. EmCRT TaxID=1359167 RepID=A0A0F3NE63_9RICK|nr:hypothetical protein EMUCRT_0190 [Ehrlichia cf. muris str. EmCRT]
MIKSFYHNNINVVFDVLYILDLILRKQFIYILVEYFCIAI